MLSQFHILVETLFSVSLVSVVKPARKAALSEYQIRREPVELSEESHSMGLFRIVFRPLISIFVLSWTFNGVAE